MIALRMVLTMTILFAGPAIPATLILPSNPNVAWCDTDANCEYRFPYFTGSA